MSQQAATLDSLLSPGSGQQLPRAVKLNEDDLSSGLDIDDASEGEEDTQSPKQTVTAQTGKPLQATQERAVKLGPYMTSYRDIHKNVQAFFKTVVANMITNKKTHWNTFKGSHTDDDQSEAEKEYKTNERVLKDIKKAVPYIRFEPQKVLTLQFLASLTPDIGSEPNEDVLGKILRRAASPEQANKLHEFGSAINNKMRSRGDGVFKWLTDMIDTGRLTYEGKQTDVVEQYIELLEYFATAKETIYDERRDTLKISTI